MKIDNIVLDDNTWKNLSSNIQDEKFCNLVLAFGDTSVIKNKDTYFQLKEMFPLANIVGTSTGGNVFGNEISKYSAVVNAIEFSTSSTSVHSIDFDENDDLYEISQKLAKQLNQDGLKHVFIFCGGLKINATILLNAMRTVLGNIPISGGLAGDGIDFKETFVISNDVGKENKIVLIGFYGEKLTISTGCYGGWSEFGAKRIITKSKDNILYEIDDEPALDFYKRYLGEHVKELPGSALRFPLSIKREEDKDEMIRTLFSVNEEDKSVTFSGDVPEGYHAQLMKPDMEKLIEGAGEAARNIKQVNTNPALCLVVSCVGRKLVLGQLIEEELEELSTVLSENVTITGWYSYGEIAPFNNKSLSCLHNQTMTLTSIYED